jgi:molybdopterin molybdotransferase
MSPLVPVSEAVARIVGGVEPMPKEEVAVGLAAGRILAEPVTASRTQPPFAASAMDGYAVRAADATAGARLSLIGQSRAGKRFAGAVAAGQAVRIFTGAPVPDGADAILIQENADRPDDATVLVREAPAAGRHIRGVGLDFTEGSVVLSAGRRLTYRDVSLAAATNHPALWVRQKPVVSFIATGDELVAPGGKPGPDQIIASTSSGLAALIAKHGGEPRDIGIVGDDAAATEAAIDAALERKTNVLVTLGGASVGDHDLVRSSLARRGMSLDFWRIAMRPGMPLLFGTLGDVRVVGLPGNPVSSLVCALLFLRPLISALLGEPVTDESEAAVTGADLPANDHRQDYLRATLSRGDGLPVATAFPVQDSSMLASLARADCLLIRPPNAPTLAKGSVCRIIRLP